MVAFVVDLCLSQKELLSALKFGFFFVFCFFIFVIVLLVVAGENVAACFACCVLCCRTGTGTSRSVRMGLVARRWTQPRMRRLVSHASHVVSVQTALFVVLSFFLFFFFSFFFFLLLFWILCE